MPLSIRDLERIGQEYTIDTAAQLAIRDIPVSNGENYDIEYLSLQLNGRNPIDDIILQGLIPFKENGKSVSGLVRLLLYHYFTHTVGE